MQIPEHKGFLNFGLLSFDCTCFVIVEVLMNNNIEFFFFQSAAQGVTSGFKPAVLNGLKLNT